MYAAPEIVVQDLLLLLGRAGMAERLEEGQKARFYARNCAVVDDKGKPLLFVKFGGANPHPHVECKGRASPLVARYLRDHLRHKPTRIDHAVDRWAEGLFDRAHSMAKQLARKHGLRLSYAGDWSTPDAGRTIYLGSRKSQLFVRIYEKGLEYCARLGEPVSEELRHWVRFEVEFKPQNKRAKAMAADISAPEIWGSSAWTGDLAKGFLAMQTKPVSIRERRESNTERALRFMGAQYAAHLRVLLDQCEGDLGEFGARIADLANLGQEADAA